MLSAAPFDRVVFLGMGSSRFAALTASALLQSQGIPAWAEYASSSVPSPPSSGTLAVGISASGDDARDRRRARTPRGDIDDGRRHERRRGARSKAGADVVLPLHSGPEHGGVACVSFQATLAVLLLLAGRIGGRADPGVAGLRPAVELAASLREARGGWLDEVAALVAGGELTQATAPAHRLSSALQSALMLREGPRLNASAAETGDWLHVDVYLTKRPGYRTLLYTGSAYDDGVLEWATSRSSPVITVGEARAGAAAHVPLAPATEPVRTLVETGVAELVAAQLWAESG